MSTKHFCVDVETLGLESTTTILSIAVVYFTLDETVTYNELKQRALFVKLKSKDQITRLNRTVTKSTLDWWKEQTEAVRALAITPHPHDMVAEDALSELRGYLAEHSSPDSLYWQRGTLDSTSIESLARAANVEPLVPYNQWMDIRTAFRCLKSSCNDRAYCKVPDFDPIVVDKHHPVDDVCYDVMMLKYGV